MSVSPAILLVSLTVGVPLMLLALGVLYHAYVYGRQLPAEPTADLLGGHVEALATESAEELLFALQDAVEEMREQLAYQRDTLAGMLSEPVPAFATIAPMAPVLAPAAAPNRGSREVGGFGGSLRDVAPLVADDRLMAAGEFVGGGAAVSQAVSRAARQPRADIAELAAQGLSDRAIARELHIGLEEVRIARMRGLQS